MIPCTMFGCDELFLLLSTPMSIFNVIFLPKRFHHRSVNGICLTQFQINVIEIVTYRTQFDFLDCVTLATSYRELNCTQNRK